MYEASFRYLTATKRTVEVSAMFWSVLGFIFSLIIFIGLALWVARLAFHKFFAYEEKMADKQLIERMEDTDANRVICDGLAAFGPGQKHLWASAITGSALIIAVPILHTLYALWVRFIMTFTDTPGLRAEVFRTSISQIKGYLPTVLLFALVFGLAGVLYALRRRHHLQTDRVYPLINVPATEITGMVVGWLLYYLVAVTPTSFGSYDSNYGGMLTLSGGWVWIGSGLLMTMYLRATQNALLWAMYRYNWPLAVPAIIQMIALRNLGLPPTVIKKVELDEAEGAAIITAEVDAIDADRLRDSVLAIPGLRRPKVVALGPPEGTPTRIATQLAPRMRPLPPRAFKRKEGPPKGYGAETNLLDSADTHEDQKGGVNDKR
jgi:hypothetical protein